MINGLQIATILYQKLAASPVKDELTGGIYKMARPVNSDKEDVVINVLALTSNQLQQAVANVNIHVPNLKLSTGTNQDGSQPDTARMEVLTGMVEAVLKEVRGQGYHFGVEQPGIMIREKSPNGFSQEYYMNIRIRFFNINF